ncbi:interleukin-1 receptor type 1 [Tachyglossus aculeatus]|uniref:interleukin-1 receptor type 1 n=1 Tax=Tachyglossus aculeatus TaxID=9261 RepID=UPI0018F327EA|nr:interleukin-1 receptor type 1 [Tachyglossus aculeatus]XP_038628844.1 interleukin-1 receptor type 1 [Tachyglossus aculeatus]XP_038628852.1 interleukin-1 receptor type 1 [Tachyglossus aculeatus]XP_038628860.1 interleukin-1 receptor type 1 [Tachyglossus aculeatus]XP_038628869.1 interleukin-1 receptor type 1 [Tachyglossus aculeatus]XP_038628879.1 interleukin-1 receptor type 1 [Tachyglossus aculeatus]
MAVLRLACLVALHFSCLQAENCQEKEDRIMYIATENEVDAVRCSRDKTSVKSDVIWYRHESETPVSKENSSRIHQVKNVLWFIPTKLEDSGYYYCVTRNLTHCLRVKMNITVLKNEPGLCYQNESLYKQQIFRSVGGQIVCPQMNFLRDKNNQLPAVQWYKNCKPGPLDHKKFTTLEREGRLLLKNLVLQDGGYYTCHTSFAHMGAQYTISRTIYVTILELKPMEPPKILYPVNMSLEVELGSQYVVDCNVSGISIDLVYWTWNRKAINDPKVFMEYLESEERSGTRPGTVISRINISEVINRHYLHPFVCLASNSYGYTAAYIALRPPTPDFRACLIGGLITLAFVVVCSALVYKIFKVDIVLWYRNFCYPLSGKKVSDGKMYDAYILYPKDYGEESTYSTDIFVLKILPDVLERQCGYSLFIYGRDDLVGEDVVMVIDRNIKKSRRLIIILDRESPQYRCLGNTSEQQLAMYNALVRDGIKVILLELRKIQDYVNMPESIQFIKQKHGVLRWSGDVTEESHSANARFWKNVRYQMPPKPWQASPKVQLLSAVALPGDHPRQEQQTEIYMPS